jgi:hypothetical protein
MESDKIFGGIQMRCDNILKYKEIRDIKKYLKKGIDKGYRSDIIPV